MCDFWCPRKQLRTTVPKKIVSQKYSPIQCKSSYSQHGSTKQKSHKSNVSIKMHKCFWTDRIPNSQIFPTIHGVCQLENVSTFFGFAPLVRLLNLSPRVAVCLFYTEAGMMIWKFTRKTYGFNTSKESEMTINYQYLRQSNDFESCSQGHEIIGFEASWKRMTSYLTTNTGHPSESSVKRYGFETHLCRRPLWQGRESRRCADSLPARR